MTGFGIGSADLAEIATGAPFVLLAPDVEGAEAPRLGPVGIWRAVEVEAADDAAEAEGLRFLLQRPTTADAAPSDGATVPLPAAPGDVLAVLARDEAAGKQLAEAWASAAGDAATPPPVVLVAEDGDAAAALAPRLAELLAASLAERAALQGSLVVVREDFEAARIALAAAMRTLGLRAPQPLRLTLASEPAGNDGAVGATREGRLALRQRLGLAAEGIATLALHVAEATRLGANARLRVRLVAEESARVLGCWTVPGTALGPGWLTLDLPEPVGPLRETAVLELEAEAGSSAVLALSAAATPAVEPDAAMRRLDGIEAAADRTLALRVWTTEFGARLIVPAHFDWDEVGRALAPGLPAAVPPEVWAGARILEADGDGGDAELVSLGDEAARPVVRLRQGETATLVLPALDLRGVDLLRLEARRQVGPADGLRVSLWLQPAGMVLDRPDDLRPTGPGRRWSGWRGLGAATPGVPTILMTVPPGCDEGPVHVVVQLACLRDDGDAPTVAELSGLWLMASGNAMPATGRPLAAGAAADAEASSPRPAEGDARIAVDAPAEAEGARPTWPGMAVVAPPPAPIVEPNRLVVPAALSGRPEAAVSVAPIAVPSETAGMRARVSALLPPAPPPSVDQAAKEPAKPPPVRVSAPLPPPPTTVSPGSPSSPVAPEALPPLPRAAPLELPSAPPRPLVEGVGSVATWSVPPPSPRPPGEGPARPPAFPASGWPAAPRPEAAPTARNASFEDLRLEQHLVSPDGGYRHLEMSIIGLGSRRGLWRRLRMKLFDRRGEIGLEFRDRAGWPTMFEVWPGTISDKFGPLFRLEAGQFVAGMGALATGRDRALVETVLEALPEMARRGAEAAGLSEEETEAWAERGRRLGVVAIETAEATASASDGGA